MLPRAFCGAAASDGSDGSGSAASAAAARLPSHAAAFASAAEELSTRGVLPGLLPPARERPRVGHARAARGDAPLGDVRVAVVRAVGGAPRPREPRRDQTAENPRRRARDGVRVRRVVRAGGDAAAPQGGVGGAQERPPQAARGARAHRGGRGEVGDEVLRRGVEPKRRERRLPGFRRKNKRRRGGDGDGESESRLARAGGRVPERRRERVVRGGGGGRGGGERRGGCCGGRAHEGGASGGEGGGEGGGCCGGGGGEGRRRLRPARLSEDARLVSRTTRRGHALVAGAGRVLGAVAAAPPAAARADRPGPRAASRRRGVGPSASSTPSPGRAPPRSSWRCPPVRRARRSERTPAATLMTPQGIITLPSSPSSSSSSVLGATGRRLAGLFVAAARRVAGAGALRGDPSDDEKEAAADAIPSSIAEEDGVTLGVAGLKALLAFPAGEFLRGEGEEGGSSTVDVAVGALTDAAVDVEAEEAVDDSDADAQAVFAARAAARITSRRRAAEALARAAAMPAAHPAAVSVARRATPALVSAFDAGRRRGASDSAARRRGVAAPTRRRRRRTRARVPRGGGPGVAGGGGGDARGGGRGRGRRRRRGDVVRARGRARGRGGVGGFGGGGVFFGVLGALLRRILRRSILVSRPEDDPGDPGDARRVGLSRGPFFVVRGIGGIGRGAIVGARGARGIRRARGGFEGRARRARRRGVRRRRASNSRRAPSRRWRAATRRTRRRSTPPRPSRRARASERSSRRSKRSTAAAAGWTCSRRSPGWRRGTGTRRARRRRARWRRRSTKSATK